jgi:aryl-alcohol dehydrogenase-like predicted oxidoreductase
LRGHPRESVRVTAKLGYLTGIDGFQGVATTLVQRFSTSALWCGVEDTLARLNMSYVDDLLLHDPPTSVLESEAVWETLHDIRRQGFARHVGVSTVPKKVATAIASGATVIQMPVFEGQQMPMLDEAFDACAIHDVRLMARSPLQGGRLLEGCSGEAVGARVRTLVDYVLAQRGVTTVVVGFMRIAEIQSLLEPGPELALRC